MSQPGRELLCKITELGFFSADFIFGHILLFIMCPVILIPYVDKAHSVMLFWLRPSRQIRPPIYTAKQTKLRRRRVIRFSVLYFFLLVVFIAILAGPMAASKYPFSNIFTRRQLTFLQRMYSRTRWRGSMKIPSQDRCGLSCTPRSTRSTRPIRLGGLNIKRRLPTVAMRLPRVWTSLPEGRRPPLPLRAS